MQKSEIKMTNKSAKEIIFTFALSFSTLIFTFSIFPSLVSASSVYIDAKHKEVFVGDTIMFSVRIDSEDKSINAIEGNILLDYSTDSTSLVDINTAGSSFSLWPGKPLPSANNTSISFVGGSPNGFSSKDGVVFNIVLRFIDVGQVALTPNNLSVYLNDGTGTKDEASVKGLIIDVLPRVAGSKPVDDWSTQVLGDKTPPEPFKVYLGQDETVFDGKRFISFVATDLQSEISHYEVVESGLPPVRSETTYVLLNQSGPVEVTVVAYDSAGNMRESVYTPEQSYLTLIVIVAFALVLILVSFALLVRREMKKNDSIQKSEVS